MKLLYLLRHAHAGSHNSGLADFDRPLDERGWQEAEAVAAYIQTKGLHLDRVMCSAALRTQETLEPLRSIVDTQQIEISESFYNIPEDQILDHLKQLPDEVGSVLYIGHNPGIAFAMLRLAQSVPDLLKDGVEPATLIGFRVPLDQWGELSWKMGEIIDFFHPNLGQIESLSPEEL
jgi:phosphohistidine phosphatase